MARRDETHCYRCGYVWTPRRSRVRICARCKSPSYWLPKLRIPTGGSGLGIADLIGAKRARVLRLARNHGATNLRIFGSVARREATAESDIDVLVDRATDRRFDQLGLALSLAKTLGRDVDLTAEDDLFWLVQPQVVAEAVPL
jgi:uncharacterized protein